MQPMASDKVLVVSYSGFSDTNANGKTLQALLSAYSAEELIQFYRGYEHPNFAFARAFFHVTDKQMLKSFLMKRTEGERKGSPANDIEQQSPEKEQSAALSGRLRKHNYNFWLRWIREILWCVAPWGRKRFFKWIEKHAPKALVYMVGESIFEDRLVRKIAKKMNIPLILYNCEGYRLVDLTQRRGIERLFYYVVEKSYGKILSIASAVIYNCDYLKCRYQQQYRHPECTTLAFNAAAFDTTAYAPAEKEMLSIVYFGNLGVGRVASLLEIADAIHEIQPGQQIHIYGRPSEEDGEKLKAHPAVVMHGFVNQDTLLQVRETADILLHVESFDPQIMPKLKYAFSTKIAQCLCSGRCVLTYAPADMASTEYLMFTEAACVATTKLEMRKKLQSIMESAESRKKLADRGLKIAKENHDLRKTAERIRAVIGATYEN